MQTGSAFESTQWSLILSAPDDPEALSSLLGRYVGPIYAFIRRTGRNREEAADLAQEFIAKVVLERGLIDRADPERGRFRTFLKTALSRFLIDEHRRATARVRSPGVPALQGLRLEELEPPEGVEPGDAFDRQWAATILSVALERVRADCDSCGQQAHWEAFRLAILDPVMRHTAPPPYDRVAAQIGAADAAQVSSMIQTVRRKFRRMMERVVVQTVAEPGLADEELAILKSLLKL